MISMGVSLIKHQKHGNSSLEMLTRPQQSMKLLLKLEYQPKRLKKHHLLRLETQTLTLPRRRGRREKRRRRKRKRRKRRRRRKRKRRRKRLRKTHPPTATDHNLSTDLIVCFELCL